MFLPLQGHVVGPSGPALGWHGRLIERCRMSMGMWGDGEVSGGASGWGWARISAGKRNLGDMKTHCLGASYLLPALPCLKLLNNDDTDNKQRWVNFFELQWLCMQIENNTLFPNGPHFDLKATPLIGWLEGLWLVSGIFVDPRKAESRKHAILREPIAFPWYVNN